MELAGSLRLTGQDGQDRNFIDKGGNLSGQEFHAFQHGIARQKIGDGFPEFFPGMIAGDFSAHSLDHREEARSGRINTNLFHNHVGTFDEQGRREKE